MCRVAQMAGDAAIGVVTGGGSMLSLLARSFGGGVQEARGKGYSEEEQLALGLTSAATEYFSERLFGGNPVYDTDVGLVNWLVGKVVKNPTVMKVLASAPVETVNEGLEEMVSGLLNPALEWAITGNRPEYELDELIEEGATGILAALLARGGAAVVNRTVKNSLVNDATADDLLRDRKAMDFLSRKGGLELKNSMTQAEKRQAVRDAVDQIVGRGENKNEDPLDIGKTDDSWEKVASDGMTAPEEKAGQKGLKMPEQVFRPMRDYLGLDGTLDQEKVKQDYRNFLQDVPEKNRMYLEQALDAVESEVSEEPTTIFLYDGESDKIIYNPKNVAFNYYDVSVVYTHELAHRIDKYFVRAAENTRFVQAIQKAGAVIDANPEMFVQFCRENDREGFCSDILSAICKDKYKFPMRHEADYWNKKTQAGEIFANLFSIEVYQDTVKMEFLRKHFPELIACFETLDFYIH